jgi:hypothetical protein
MVNLLGALDNIANRRAITASQLAYVLKQGYAVWMRGYLELTPYGQQVLCTLSKAA